MVSVGDAAICGPLVTNLMNDDMADDGLLCHSLDVHLESASQCKPDHDKESQVEETEAKIETESPTLQKQHGKTYHCKYCSFYTQSLSDFRDHVYSAHPGIIMNPLYLCAVCNFSTKRFDSLAEHNEMQHAGESNFKFKQIRLDNQTVLEQTIESEFDSNSPDSKHMQDDDDAFNFIPLCPSTEQNVDKPISSNEKNFKSNIDHLLLKDQITAINVNGTIIIPEPVMLEGLSHVMPLLQRPPNLNSAPTIAVPLNTSKYNPLLDTNTTLIASFNKFPYPTHAELSWLTVASKHPEEQIRVWFTTQRLKQGITWSPEEVEEARKKMFNGCVPPSQHSFTVLPTPASEPITTSQSVAPAVSCQSDTSSFPCSKVTVTTVNSVPYLKRPLGLPVVANEAKRPIMLTDEHKEKLLMAPPLVPPLDRIPMPPPSVPLDCKRSMLPPLIAADMKRPVVSPYALPKVKFPSVYPLVPPKDKVHMPPPPLLLRERPSMLPLVSTDIKRGSASLHVRNQAYPLSVIFKDKFLPFPNDLNLPLVPPLVASQVKRPTIIQTARAPLVPPNMVPNFSLENKPLQLSLEQKSTGLERRSSDSQNRNNGVPCGDGKNWFSDQGAPTHNGLRHLSNEFAPKERPKMVPTQFPLLERLKGKTAQQLKVLEESFQRNSFPSPGEVDQIAINTRLSREEIDSWFSERRALRDNLEKALLNSMGSRRTDVAERRLHSQHQHPFPNGGYKQVGLAVDPLPPIIAPTSSSVPVDRKSLNLLKDVFVQTRWPSPEQYSRLEAQTGLARTDIVRWFKDNRLALRSGTVEWKELFHSELNGRLISDQPFLHSEEWKMPTADCAKLSGREIKEWFGSSLGRHEDGRNGGPNGGSNEEVYRAWMEESVGTAKVVSRELVSDMD